MVDLIKMDVEGFEHEVLQGAHESLISGKVNFIYLETGLDDRFVSFERALLKDCKNIRFCPTEFMSNHRIGPVYRSCGIGMPFLSKKNFSSLKDIKTISCFIFVARSDFSYLATTLPPLLEMATKANCTTTILVDGTNPNGVLGQSLPQTALSKLISCLEKIQQEHSFEIK